MKTAGIRETRQNLSALLEEVKKGREVYITDRGRKVARLSPLRAPAAKPFASLRAFRKTMPVLDPPLSETVIAGREDRV
jgi:prevent-host-death family protein